MDFLRKLYSNHPLANIAFVVVMVLGLMSYLNMPREKDPQINFNWVSIVGTLPGASAEDIERLVLNPLEDAVKGVPDVRFVVSTSRENVASLLVRFREMNDRTFDKRMNDLRREIQNKAKSELPREAKDPFILEITTSNGFPTAGMQLIGLADDETLRANGRRIKGDLERMTGIDQVFASGLRDPELRVTPNVSALAARGLTATDVSDSLQAWWRDTAAGTLKTKEGAWSVSLRGVETNPESLASIPIVSPARPGVSARLSEVSRIERVRAPATQLSSTDGKPAITLNITKKTNTNTLALIDRVKQYIDTQNQSLAASGLKLVMTDDQTVPTREAIKVMESNALYGFLLVLVVCWLFLGWRVSVLVSLGIPFSLLATFAVLSALGYTVNVSVLLGVVIALGMLVDDAVVIVEAIYYRVERGEDVFDASVNAVRETGLPVLTSVATTMAAFLPLMLLPGIVGKFMFIIPFVVSLALAISLIEAFWMMPTHVSAVNLKLDNTSRGQRLRNAFNRKIRLWYGKSLTFALRRPLWCLLAGVAAVAAAVWLFMAGAIKVQFFSFDPIRAFYVNIDMPPNATVEETLAETERIEKVARQQLKGIGLDGEARSTLSTAGIKFTQTEPVYGEPYGQVFISLNPNLPGARSVPEVVDATRAAVEKSVGIARVSVTSLSGGPPAGKPIAVKVRGDKFEEIQAAAEALKTIARGIKGTKDVQDDNQPGRDQINLTLDRDAMRNAGLSAVQLSRLVRLAIDGEVIAFTRTEGDKIEVRVRAEGNVRRDPGSFLDEPIALPNGQITRLGALVKVDVVPGRGFIKHYNLRRTVTVEGDLDKAIIDTPKANQIIKDEWAKVRAQHPNVDLDFSGELEDLEESLNAMKLLFLMGVGLIYLILAAQFMSYWQPLMILVTVPLAFSGVAYGLALTQNPMSLYTLYGVIALTGIAVNSAIVLIDAANERRAKGMSTVHAVVTAARRRVVPILITTTTTLGGLFSLAFGIGGKSLLWGPVASSIFWGLLFSTVLTLFIIPLIYLIFMRNARVRPSLWKRMAARFGRRRVVGRERN
jgi:multidrug efflux pump subunit AcrB